MKITDDIFYVGVNDRKIDLFEGQYDVPNGMAYNSYLISDAKIAVMDTVDASFTHEWLDNVQKALGKRKPDYLVVQHMEPDHSANIANFLNTFPQATVVSSAKAFAMMQNFFGTDFLPCENGDYSFFCGLAEELYKRGYTKEKVAKIFYGNLSVFMEKKYERTN